MKVLHQLRDAGNTIVVIEHNLDVIKTADWCSTWAPKVAQAVAPLLCAGTPRTWPPTRAATRGVIWRPLLRR